MTETKKQQLEKILSDLKKIGSIIGSAVVSQEGLLIASDLSRSIDCDTLAAMSAAMQSAAQTALEEIRQGTVRNVIIDSNKGKIVTVPASQGALLVVLTESDINLGLLLLTLKKILIKIDRILA